MINHGASDAFGLVLVTYSGIKQRHWRSVRVVLSVTIHARALTMLPLHSPLLLPQVRSNASRPHLIPPIGNVLSAISRPLMCGMSVPDGPHPRPRLRLHPASLIATYYTPLNQ